MRDSEATNNRQIYDIVVLGGGVTGLAAALTGGRSGLRTLLLERAVFGGSVAVLESVTGYPGIQSIGGWELTQTMVKQARDAGCELIDSIEVAEVSGSFEDSFGVNVNRSGQLQARTVIISTGGEPLMLELAEEAHFAQHGIHTCVQCAGARYKGKTVAIAGNNSWAVRAAEHLLKLDCTVLYITGDTEMCGDAAVISNLKNHGRFRFLGGCNITGLYGGEYLEEILITGLDSGNYQKIKVPAVFVYRGIKPNSSIVRAEKNRKGFLRVDENSMTSLVGVFAAGRVVQADPPIEVMVGDGSRAALSAASWVRSHM